VSVIKPIVKIAPKITKPLEAVVAKTGSKILLEATYLGTPEPEVKWYRNGKEIVTGTKGKVVKTENHKTTLSIPEIARADVGKYEVRAVNEVGEAKSSGTVAVIG
jgi:hypothetical protein